MHTSNDSDHHIDASRLLSANDTHYMTLLEMVRTIDSESSPETVLGSVSYLADFCCHNHTGRFFDGALDNPIVHLGGALGRRDSLCSDEFLRLEHSRRNVRHVLHVATAVHSIGGLGRMLNNWIRNDRGTCHSVVITNQGPNETPSWLREAVADSGGGLIVMPSSEPLMIKALWLRRLARSNVDLVVLHHGGHDVVPVAAFAARDCPPVAVLNHADHIFWVGSSIADTTINLRPVGQEWSEARRSTRHNCLLPIPLSDLFHSLTRGAARIRLGIPERQPMLLSVGRSLKFVPDNDHNFFRTAAAILVRNQKAHLYVVGVNTAQAAPFLGDIDRHRVHLIGVIDNPADYQAATDVYLEGFPFGSQTAALEAAMAGVPVVLAYAPPVPMLTASDDAFADMGPPPLDEQSYVQKAVDLLENPSESRVVGASLRKCTIENHIGAGWLSWLERLYAHTDSLSHCVDTIPVSSCERTTVDLALSAWHWFQNVGRRGAPSSLSTLNRDALGMAYYARSFGEYSAALRLVSQAVTRWGVSREMLLEGSKTLFLRALHMANRQFARSPQGTKM